MSKVREALKAADNASPGYPLWSEAMYVLDELEAENERLREALQDACDVAIWMSGSSDFSPGGVAHEGWIGGMRDKLHGALAALAGKQP